MSDIFGIDLAYAHTTTTGDMPTISGLANYRQALINRWITEPGQFAARPEYGAGLNRYKDAIMTISMQKQLAKDIQAQTLLDKRTEEFLGVQIFINDNAPGLAKILVKVKPVGHQPFGITFSPFADEA